MSYKAVLYSTFIDKFAYGACQPTLTFQTKVKNLTICYFLINCQLLQFFLSCKTDINLGILNIIFVFCKINFCYFHGGGYQPGLSAS